MFKRIIYLIFFLPTIAFAQSVTDIDRETYSLYNEGKWNELIDVGKKALDTGIDFYYLRSRMAISYYNLKNYRKSIPLFEKVYSDYPADPMIREYLYWAYLLSGRQKDALRFIGKLSDEDRKRMNVHPRAISKIYAEGGIGTNPGYEEHSNTPITGDEEKPGDEMGFKDQTYLSLGMEHELTHWLSLKHAYTNIEVNRYQRFEYPDFPGYQFSHAVKQDEYYIGANFALGNGWHLQPSCHFVWVNLNPTLYSIEDQLFYYDKVAYNDGVGFLGIRKELDYFTLSLSGLAGTLNLEDISQLSGGFVFYPKGNLDLYIASSLCFQNRKKDQLQESSTIVRGKVGARTGKFWLEGNVTLGELKNFVENENQTIWNSFFPVKKKFGGSILLPLANYKVNLSLRYIFLEMEGFNTHYIEKGSGLGFGNSNNYTTVTTKYRFNNHLITGGIVWNL